jgi:hypothetical protein
MDVIIRGTALGSLRSRSLVDCDTLDAKGTFFVEYCGTEIFHRRSDIDLTKQWHRN